MASNECALCIQPGFVVCESCAEFDDSGVALNPRWYCSVFCREIDRTNHVLECRLIAEPKEMFERAKRAADVVQALFYTFIEHTWAYDMSRVKIIRNTKGAVIAVETMAGSGARQGPANESSCERTGAGWLFKFPHDCVRVADEAARHALLANQNSIWAFVAMHVAVQVLFENLVEDVERDIKEVVHYLPDNTRRLVKHKGRFKLFEDDRNELPYQDEDAKGHLKGVYQITLKNGTKIALDLAGAQYNLQHDTILTWPTYLDRWMAAPKYRIVFRSHYNKHVENMSTYRCVTHLTVIMEQATFFNSLLKTCDFKLGFNLKDLPAEDFEIFRNYKQRLLAAVGQYLQPRHADSDPTKTKNLPVPFDLRHPKVIDDAELELPESLPPDVGSMKDFRWDNLSKLIQLTGNTVHYKEKKFARHLLDHRCAYKMPGDWRIMYLWDTMPSPQVPSECVSENPTWQQRKRR